MLTVQVDDAAVLASLKRLAQRCQNLTPAMNAIGHELTENIRLGFKSATSPYGQRWQPLAQSTILGRLGKNKSNFLKSGKISARGQREAMAGFVPLSDTGQLRNSISHQADATGVTVGTNLIYAATHQFGRMGPRGRIPARPFMPIRNGQADLPPAWQADIINLIARHVQGAQGSTTA